MPPQNVPAQFGGEKPMRPIKEILIEDGFLEPQKVT